MHVNSLQIPESDIMGTNGVIHFVNHILYPGGKFFFLYVIINLLPLQVQKPKPTTLSSRYPCWKPESPQAAEKADHQHTNQGTATKPDIKPSKMHFTVPLWTDDAINHHFCSMYISTLFHINCNFSYWLQHLVDMNSSLFPQYTSGYKYQDIPLTFLSE